MKYYRVVDNNSVYYGRVGADITKERAIKNWEKECAKNGRDPKNGRDRAYWAEWDVYLDFTNIPLKGIGMGYTFAEVVETAKGSERKVNSWKRTAIAKSESQIAKINNG